MIFYRLKHVTGNDLNRLLEAANTISMEFSNNGHEIRRMDVFFDKASLHHNRKPSHSIVIHYMTEIQKKPEEDPPAE